MRREEVHLYGFLCHQHSSVTASQTVDFIDESVLCSDTSTVWVVVLSSIPSCYLFQRFLVKQMFAYLSSLNSESALAQNKRNMISLVNITQLLVPRSKAMLSLRLFISLLLPQISYQISCYDCSNAPNEFQYLITVDRIPPEVENCPLIANQTSCLISLVWQLTFQKTELNLLGNPNIDPSPNPQHVLRANALVTGSGVMQQWQHSIAYRCATDQCNNLAQFKLLLRSLTLTSNFSDLNDLLIPQSPFNGSWCLLAKNRTDVACSDASTINPQSCQQCFTVLTAEAGADRLCASCFTTDQIEQESLERGVLFNMSSRTSTETWKIYCRAPNCNGLDTGASIRRRSTVAFDFNQFLGVPAGQEQLVASVFVNGLVLLVIFALKTIYWLTNKIEGEKFIKSIYHRIQTWMIGGWSIRREQRHVGGSFSCNHWRKVSVFPSDNAVR